MKGAVECGRVPSGNSGLPGADGGGAVTPVASGVVVLFSGRGTWASPPYATPRALRGVLAINISRHLLRWAAVCAGCVGGGDDYAAEPQHRAVHSKGAVPTSGSA